MQCTFEQMVGTEAGTGALLLDHEILELGDVARRLEHRLGRDARAVYLEHVLLNDEVRPPAIKQVGLDGTTHGAIVVQTSNA